MALIISWNVNSIKSRLPLLERFIREHNPDILLLQEIKCIENNFPKLEIESWGYNIAICGQKTFNGVAILSKSPIEDITKKLNHEEEQARYIECFTTIGNIGFRVASVYVPNGQEVGSDKFSQKMKFYDELNKHLNALSHYDEALVVGGDFNVAPDEIDVYDSKSLEGTIGFHIKERKWFRTILNQNSLFDSFRLINPSQQEFSWWDYRGNSWQHNKGMRIDQILVSSEAADKLTSAGIHHDIRGQEKSSDHAPIYCRFAST